MLIFGGIAASCFAWAQEASSPQLQLSIKIYELGNEDSQQRVFAEPLLVTPAGRPFSLDAGGIVKTDSGDDLKIGIQVTGKLERPRADLVSIAIKAGVGTQIIQDNDPKTVLVKTDTFDIRAVVRLGETKRFRFSEIQCCEICVDSVKN
ncbi:MAG TPA: hypothetical protein VNQ76_14010 [Planctomicrobium sp.]|nr:hypothetical protein [Planctomicrobium sp.]